MPRLSILSLLLITAYFAICALNYTSRNTTIGFLVVVATAILIAVTMIRSFQTRNAFGLGFCVVASLWLPLSLGFVIETPKATKLYDLRTPIWKAMSFGRTFPKFDAKEFATFKNAAFHDLYSTRVSSRLPDDRVPNHRNALQLAACWSSLFAGLIGGACYILAVKRNPNLINTSTGERCESVKVPLLTVTSAFFGVSYFAICALNYVSENLTLGWIFVILTGVVFVVALIRSFQSRSSFRLGFAAFGSLWLASTLGFSLETSTDFKTYDLRTPVWNVMKLGRSESPPIEDYTTLRESKFHDLYVSIVNVRLPNFREIPGIENTMRLAACWSALFIGLLGGICFSLTVKPS